MKKHKTVKMLLIVLAISLILNPGLALADPPPTTNIILSCSAQQAHIGDTVTVQIKCDQEAHLYGVEFTLNYQPSMLKPVAGANGKYLQTKGTYARLDSLDSQVPDPESAQSLQAGVLRYPLHNSDLSSASTKDIASISFQVLKNGTATLRLSDIQAVAAGSHIVNDNMSYQVEMTTAAQIVYTVPQDAAVVNVPENTDVVDVSSLPGYNAATKSAVLPEINFSTLTSISGEPIQVNIPGGTTISAAAGSDWQGRINTPAVKDISVLDPGSNTVYSIIEIGFENVELTFDKPVRILFPDQAGREVGYSRNGGPITNIPTNNGLALTSGDALGAARDGKKEINGDLVVWTRHFTYFAIYTPSGTTPGGGTGGGIVVSPGGGIWDPAAGTVPRLAGSDRFETANAIAEKGWPEGAETVVLAYAYDFPDALAAAPLAKKLNAPILLSDKTSLTPVTLTEIQKLKAKKVVLIGGPGVISQGIQDSLSATYGQANVTRYSGEDRYATAAAIAGALGSTGRAVVVSGQNYPDALAISSYAAAQGIPILFTGTSTLPSATSQVLSAQAVSATIVAGGEGAVAAGVFNQLPGASRYGGTDRYATAAALIDGLNLKLDNVYVVTGLDFPDALVAGNLAAYTESPLLMVDQGLPEATRAFLAAHKASIKGATIIGGQGAVSEAVVNDLLNALK
ncbi:MAG TPA: cell wall-binding repeat-containing protein [Desulfitobacteriaceae bacterium]|jgi:putative cell wall-binding protein|nr:cell wall-binding repeat-containing protein [Desulfitobacteriaceae bacterium]